MHFARAAPTAQRRAPMPPVAFAAFQRGEKEARPTSSGMMQWCDITHPVLRVLTNMDIVYPTLIGLGLMLALIVLGVRRTVVGGLLLSAPWVVRHPQPYYLSCSYWYTREPYMVLGATVAGWLLCKVMMARLFKFDRRVIHEIGVEASKKATRQEKFEYVVKELQRRYPGKTVDTMEWVYYSSGGALGSMTILYASMFEYIMINGSSIPFIGHTGRNPVNYSDTLLDGEAIYFDSERPYERAEYKAGDYCYAPEWEAYGTCVRDHCWFLEYARGFIPYLLPFGYADTLFSTLDFVNLLKIQWLYTKRNIQAMFS